MASGRADKRRQLEDTLLRLDIEHQEQTAPLRMELNQLSAVNRLPVEILSRIFVLYVHSDPSHYLWSPSQWSPLVMAVCSHWRAVAIDCAELWSSPYLNCRKWTEVMLERSKGAKLCVSLNWPKDRDAEQIRSFYTCVRDLDRIKKLEISSDMNEPFECLTSPAPALETLVLNCTGTIPTDLLGRSVPNLRHLELSTTIPWALGLFSSSMTDLNISFRVSESQQPLGTISEFLTALENMPFLRDLVATSRGARYSNNPVELVPTQHLSKTVYLSQLQRMTITASMLEATEIATHVIFPQSTYIKMGFTYCPYRISHFQDLVSFVSSRCRHNTSIRKFQFMYRGYSQEYFDLELKTDAGPYLDLSMIPVEGAKSGLEVAQPFLDCICLQNLQAVKFDAPIPGDIWCQRFGHLAGLKYIGVTPSAEEQDSLNLLAALRMGLSDRDGDKLAFPALNQITLWLCSSEGIESLISVARLRCEKGLKIQKLLLKGCERGELSDEQSDELERCVGKVNFAFERIHAGYFCSDEDSTGFSKD